MAAKALILDLTTGRAKQSESSFLDVSDASLTPYPDKVPRADSSGTIESGWIPVSTRSVNIRETDGSPVYVAITDLVVGNGDLSYIGEGAARLRTASDAVPYSGGGESLTVTDTFSGIDYTEVTVIEFAGAYVEEVTPGTVLVTASGTGGTSSESSGSILYLFRACY